MGVMTGGLTYTRRTNSADATRQLAATLAPYLHEGDVIVLSGDLCAGKTLFVQGVASALGVTSNVTSPTFGILQSYDEGRITMHHLDLYRLEEPSDLDDVDYHALVNGDGDGAVFVEWGDKFPDELPCDYLEVTIEAVRTGQRTVRIRSYGQRARQLLFVWASDSKARLVPVPGGTRS